MLPFTNTNNNNGIVGFRTEDIFQNYLDSLSDDEKLNNFRNRKYKYQQQSNWELLYKFRERGWYAKYLESFKYDKRK